MFHKKNFERHQNYMEDTFNLAVLEFQWLWVKQKGARSSGLRTLLR